MQCQSGGNMNDVPTENISAAVVEILETQDVRSSESAENFQKFMYELFEKNGVINDLRAYLRGHIVSVLKSAQTGDFFTCQKNFTQRLELPYQAMNVLLAEYMLRMEFNYALSVFISEIPLANMVFAFAKSLMSSSSCDAGLRFKDEDIWSILNCLGIKCDSEHASNIVTMYKSEKQSPLLLCILKCIPLYKKTAELHPDSSQDSLSSSIVSSDALGDRSRPHRIHSDESCKHFSFCKTCQSKIIKIKDKYAKKKKTLAKNVIESNIYGQSVESVMKSIDVIEKTVINEMFQQLKHVYEAEIEQMKNEEEKRMKRTLLAHATNLQRKRDEMEERFKAREAELERNVQQKKRFLWGLARALRDQHLHMSRAMQDVQRETSRLSAKEDSLKSQLAEAEQILRERGEEMRHQISNELVILEEHLDSMKRERENINKERRDLENIKQLCVSSPKTTNAESNSEDLRSHYDLLKNEFTILKTYLETSKLEPKCVVEKSTITELADVTTKIDVVLNNGQDVERARSEDRLKPNQVLNDLKKQKNVNFSQWDRDQIYVSRTLSPASNNGAVQLEARSSLRRLREDNERLRTFATQQRDHIDELSSQQARLQAELAAARLSHGAAALSQRPRTAPATVPDFNVYMQRLNGGASGHNLSWGWRKGAGEELSLFASPQTRVVVPGDTLPFVGVVRERRADSRRYLINQWRSLRRRASPVKLAQTRPISPKADTSTVTPMGAGPSSPLPAEHNDNDVNLTPVDNPHQLAREQFEQRPDMTEPNVKPREKSPKSVLKHKGHLRTKDNNTRFGSRERTKSPTSVIRDAKLRLRKLEIEAEAVEQSYMDFRRKREALRDETRTTATDDKYMKQYTPISKINKTSTKESSFLCNKPQICTTYHLAKFVDEYRPEYNASKIPVTGKNATAFSSYETAQKIQNYLETPMSEFRKYYQSEKRIDKEERFKDDINTSNNNITPINKNQEYSNITYVADNSRPFDGRPTTAVTENLDVSEGSVITNSRMPDNSSIINGRIAPTETLNTSPKSGDQFESNSNVPIVHAEKVDDRYLSEITRKENCDLENVANSDLQTFINSEIGKFKDRPRSPLHKNEENSDASISTKSVKVPDCVADNVENRSKSPTTKHSDDNDIETRKEILRKMQHNKVLDVLDQDNNKFHNLSNESINKDPSKSLSETLNVVKLKDEEIKNNDEMPAQISRSEVYAPAETRDIIQDKNVLRIELQSVSNVNDLKYTESQTQDLLIVVESFLNADKSEHAQSDLGFEKDKFSTNMTILGSPRTNDVESDIAYSPIKKRINDYAKNALHSIGNLSDDDANNKVSKDALDQTMSQLDANEDLEYPDDFSGDVDNFEMEDDKYSPISMAKTSDDENFWDS